MMTEKEFYFWLAAAMILALDTLLIILAALVFHSMNVGEIIWFSCGLATALVVTYWREGFVEEDEDAESK